MKTRNRWDSGWESTQEEVTRPPLDIPELGFKNILVPIDFSQCSRKALDLALALAKKHDAALTLLHVFVPVPGELKILESTFVETSFRDEAVESLVEWERGVRSLGFQVKGVFRDAYAVHREIVKVAAETATDLIVMGKHQHGRFDSLFSDRIISKVVDHVSCPVIAAR